MAKKSNSNSKNKKGSKKSFWKTLLIILLIIAAAFIGIKLYEKYTNKDVSIGIIGGADGPTVVITTEEKSPVPVETETEDIVTSLEAENPVTQEEKTLSANSNVSEFDLGHEEETPLYFGNPTDAQSDTSLETNYLMEKVNYTMSYNNDTLCPNWVGWHLDKDDIGDAPRSNKFVADKALPEGWHGVTKAEYQFNKYGFDRGHICPSADRTYSQDANNETFLMTNMVPQAPDNNRVVWVALEKYQREIVDNGNEVYIFAGPAGTGGEGAKGYFDYISIKADDGSELKINVPAYTWKILLILPEGQDDLSRVTEDTEVISVCVPNKNGINSDLSWKKYLCSVDDIEELTGYDFFEILDDNLEEKLESSVISIDSL